MKIRWNPNISHLLTKHLILEDVYYDDVFEQLTEYILNKLKNDSILRMSFQEILDKLPDWWPGKKYLKKERNLIVINIDFKDKVEIVKCLTKLDFTDNEIDSIIDSLSHDRGLYCTDLEKHDRTITFIFLNTRLTVFDLHETLCHELIHLFQDSSGRSKYKVNTKKLFELTDEDEHYIKDILNLDKSTMLNIFNQDEIVTYTREAYSYIKKKTGFTERFDMNMFFADMSYTLRNKFNYKSFKEYFDNVKNTVTDKHIKEIFLQNSKNNPIAINMIIVAYYLGLGVNTIKNHLYGYMNKDKFEN